MSSQPDLGLTPEVQTTDTRFPNGREAQNTQAEMQKINPSLWFDHQAEEAANFYVSIFKDAKILNVTRYGSAGRGPEGSVMTVDFQLHGQDFNAINGGPQFKFTEAISLLVNCESQAEVDEYWEKLSDDGEAGPMRLAQEQVRFVLADRTRRAG